MNDKLILFGTQTGHTLGEWILIMSALLLSLLIIFTLGFIIYQTRAMMKARKESFDNFEKQRRAIRPGKNPW